MVAAIAGFAVWPVVPDTVTAADLMSMVANSPFKAVVVLDPVVVLVPLCLIPVYLALFICLHGAHRSLTTIALALGFVSVAASITTRPIIDLFSIADLYQRTTDPQTRQLLLSAGTTMLHGYHGTAWTIGVLCSATSFLISSILMRRQVVYRRATAWAGVVANGGSLLVISPVVGRFLLFILGTVVGVAWLALLAVDLRRAALDASTSEGPAPRESPAGVDILRSLSPRQHGEQP
jgi:hypothetical protein